MGRQSSSSSFPVQSQAQRSHLTDEFSLATGFHLAPRGRCLVSFPGSVWSVRRTLDSRCGLFLNATSRLSAPSRKLSSNHNKDMLGYIPTSSSTTHGCCVSMLQRGHQEETRAHVQVAWEVRGGWECCIPVTTSTLQARDLV